MELGWKMLAENNFKKMVEQQRAKQRIIADGILLELKDKIIVISEHTETYKKYKKELQEKFYDLITEGFEFKDFREHPIHFRFFPEGTIYTMQFRHFVTNLLFWGGIVRIDPNYLDEKHLIDCTTINGNTIKNYIDNLLIPHRNEVEHSQLNVIIHDVLYNLGRISRDFNEILAISMNVETFIDLANRYPRFNEIMHTKLSDDMQPKEIETLLKQLTEEQMNIIKNDTQYNHLKPIMLSSGSIKKGQFKEFAINAGLKPDLTGSTIPKPVNTNFITGGLNTVASYYIDSLAGRKSLIMNKTVMGSSGHFARLIMLITSDVTLRQDDEVCNSVHPIPIEIKSQDHLEKLRHRYYKLPHQRKYSVMRGDETELIGETIMLKSPITCASEEGICRQCYGELFNTNRTLNSAGGLSATKISEPVTQNILSSKHLLETDSEYIEFDNEEFYRFFNVFTNEIMLNKEADDIENCSLVIIRENLLTLEEFDSDINTFVNIFHVKDTDGNMHEFVESTGKGLFLSPEFSRVINKLAKSKKKSKEDQGSYIEIPFSSIGYDEKIFVVEINNNELTRPLYDIMYLLNNKKERAKEGIEKPEQAAQRLMDLLVESDIEAGAIHGEMILRSLIRSQHDILELPDFTRYDAMNDTQLLTISTALNNHPSVTVSLSFQYLLSQLESPLTFKKKSTSYLDPFFKKKIEESDIIEIESE